MKDGESIPRNRCAARAADDSTHAASALPVVAVLIPTSTRGRILPAEAERSLADVAEVRSAAGPVVTSEDVPELLDGAIACVTGWGTPSLGEDLLAKHLTLRLVAHTAGSIRSLVPATAIERGLRVSHAAAIIADAVAELVISQALLGLRRLHEIDRAMKAGGDWGELREGYIGRLLGGQTVGVIGAGYVGRIVVRLFKAFGCKILVYDPLLTESEADALGINARPLDDLLATSDVVTVHAPVLPETRKMIGAAQLARLRDGAVFINTARAVLVDNEALLHEVRSGRIFVALDVFEQEPLPVDAPIRTVPNVVLSPHLAGHTDETYFRQGQAMVDEVQRFLRGEPLRYEITAAMLPVMA